MTIVNNIVGQFSKLESDRSNYENRWQEISDYVLPNRGDFNVQRSKGDNSRRTIVFDSTAEQSNNLLASSLYGGLVNPSSKWFHLSVQTNLPQKLTSQLPRWLEFVTDEMFKVFNSPNSGFGSQVHEFFLSLCSYGTAAMFVEEDVMGGARFSAIHLSEIFIAEDKSGVVDTVFRKFKMTARQMAQKWAENIHPSVAKCLEKEPNKKFEIIHCVKPATDEDVKVGKAKYVSYYVDLDNKALMSTGKYFEIPYVVARFSKMAGDIYGRGPAWAALPDIKLVNKIKETTIKAAQLQAQPPLLVADDGVMNPLRAMPNGIIAGGLSYDGLPKVQPLNIGGNLGISEAILQSEQKMIRDAFYIDAFVFRDTMMTATEARLRQQEQLRLLAPHVGRIQSEFLQPVILKLFRIMLRSGRIGDLPEELEKIDYSVEYTSPLAMLQKSTDVQAIQNFISTVAPLAQVNPAALDSINFDAAIAKTADSLGVPASVLYTPEEMEQRRQQQAEQQAMQQAAMMMQQAGGLDPGGQQ